VRDVSIGIDIGTTAVTTAVVERMADGTIAVRGIGRAPSAGLRRGMIVDVDATAQSIRRSVLEASKASGATIRAAVVGIGGTHLGSFTTRGAVAVTRTDGEITEQDATRALAAAEGFISKNPNREIVHVIPREFRVDGQGGVMDPVGLVGMKLEVEALVIDGARPALQNIVKACELAGIEVRDWVANVVAASSVLLNDQQRELGAMLLDLGAGTTDFAIFEEGRLLDAGVIPIGGTHITADIAIGLRTNIAAAEQIKLRYASALPDPRATRRDTIALGDFVRGDSSVFAVRDLVDIIGARLTDVFELATKAMKRVGRAGLLPGGIVLVGGAASIPAIQELARRELRLPVETATELSIEGMPLDAPTEFAVSIGLALWEGRGLRFAPRHANRFGSIWEGIKRVLRTFVP